jgi:hypothetical protein
MGRVNTMYGTMEYAVAVMISLIWHSPSVIEVTAKETTIQLNKGT